MDQPELDARLQSSYTDEFVEAERLTTRSAQGRLELGWVQGVVRGLVPAGSRVVDVGGATGVLAAALGSAGYDVVLVDPVPAQVAQAARVGTFRAVVGDARHLELADDWADAAVLLGPLCHLASRVDRLTPLSEAARVRGGWVVAAALPCLARLTSTLTAQGLPPVSTDQWTRCPSTGIPPTSVASREATSTRGRSWPTSRPTRGSTTSSVHRRGAGLLRPRAAG